MNKKPFLTCCVSVAAAALLSTVAPRAHAADFDLAAALGDPAAGSERFAEFGRFMTSIDGNLLVGAPNGTPSGGAVHLFNVDPASADFGRPIRSIPNPEPGAGHFFGQAAVSLNGNLIVGAMGSGRVYEFAAGSDPVHTFTSPEPVLNFGLSLAAPAGNLAVGAKEVVYLFDGQPASPTYRQLLLRLPLPDFAVHMATIGKNLLVTARRDSTAGPAAGAVYLFDTDPLSATFGTLLHKFLNPRPTSAAEFDIFGVALAALGTKVLVGANQEKTVGPAMGAVYLFDGELSSPTFGALLRTVAPPEKADHFGTAIATLGDTFIVGAMRDGGLGAGQGAAYLIDTDGNVLGRFPNPNPNASVPPHDEFGFAVASVNGMVVIGAPNEKQAGISVGAAYIFHVDRDGDGLLDPWERYGLDVNNDGVVDLDLPALGADPNRKDLFVEVDYMRQHRPRQAALDSVVTAFANAPVNNPAGGSGIALHLHVDEELAHEDAITVARAYALKAAQFGTAADRASANAVHILEARRRVYRYALFVHTLDDNLPDGTRIPPNISGVAELPGNDFIVSLGYPDWGTDASGHTVGSESEQAGTFMHELGHTLGLRHGGDDDHNCKPNYLSVMSYSRQFPYFIADRPLDYSREAIAALDETGLDEALGVPSRLGLATVYGPWPPQNSLTGVPIDWGRDGTTGGIVSADINNLDIFDCNAPQRTGLRGFNDWANLRYNFRATDGYASGIPASLAQTVEMTSETVRQIRISNLSALDDAIQRLAATAFDNPRLANQRKNALHNKLLVDADSVAALVNAGRLREAIDKLIHDIRPKTDGSAGGNPRNDWIVDAGAQAEILRILDNVVATFRRALD